jgi:hypothetical protein
MLNLYSATMCLKITAISFSTIFSATRGSIGLMSLSWTAFSVSFSLCVYVQWTNPQDPTFAVAAYPHARILRFRAVFVAFLASVVGIVLMSITLLTLDLQWEGTPNTVDRKIKTLFGGGLSLLAVVSSFIVGCARLWFNTREARRISIIRANRIGSPGRSI